MKQMSADEIMDQIAGLEDETKKALVRDIIGDLQDFLKNGPFDGDTDTWACGFQSAIAVVEVNYSH